MKYKNDMDAAQKRLKAFWSQEVDDRCVIHLTVPKADKNNIQTNHPRYANRGEELNIHWTDPQYIVQRYEKYFNETLFLGEAIPAIFVDLGPGSVAAYLGSQVTFKEDTVWFSKIDDIGEKKLEFDPQNKWWKLTKNLTEHIFSHGKDKYYTLISDLGGVADIQGHLRGVEELMIDSICEPEDVNEKEKAIMKVWEKCFLSLCEIVNEKEYGMVNWLNLWAPGKTYVLQSDLSCNISNDMFKKFFLPRIEEQCHYIDYPIYHLDGAAAIKHLDSIISIPEINGIQWEPGYGGGRPIERYEMLTKIQKNKKSVVISIVPGDIDAVIKYLSPEGLCLRIHCRTMDEADSIMEKITKWDRV